MSLQIIMQKKCLNHLDFGIFHGFPLNFQTNSHGNNKKNNCHEPWKCSQHFTTHQPPSMPSLKRPPKGFRCLNEETALQLEV